MPKKCGKWRELVALLEVIMSRKRGRLVEKLNLNGCMLILRIFFL